QRGGVGAGHGGGGGDGRVDGVAPLAQDGGADVGPRRRHGHDDAPAERLGGGRRGRSERHPQETQGQQGRRHGSTTGAHAKPSGRVGRGARGGGDGQTSGAAPPCS